MITYWLSCKELIVPRTAMNTYTINDLKGEFVRFFVAPEEAIYIFTELTRTNFAIISGLNVRPHEILVDKNFLEDFYEFSSELYIHFIDENGKDFLGKTELEELYSRKLPFAKHIHDNKVKKYQEERAAKEVKQ
jgi:hypothetical protein